VLFARAQISTEMSGRPRLVPVVSYRLVTVDQFMPESFDERIASAKAIAEALAGVPIVFAQQVMQNLGDISVGSNVTVVQRLSQLRALGEMTVRFGTREISKRISGNQR
jgi:hypothetical protein